MRREAELLGKATAKANLLRVELERGHDEDDESVLKLIYDDYVDLSRQIERLEMDNRVLRERLAAGPSQGPRGRGGAGGGGDVGRPPLPPNPAGGSFEEKLCFSINTLRGAPKTWGFQ